MTHRPLYLERLEDRCLPSWALDPTFTTPGYPPGHVFFPNFGEASSAVFQKDGKIVAAGYTGEIPGNQNFSVVRFLPNGQPDPTFGNGGEVNFDFYHNSGADAVLSLAIQPWDSKIVVAGIASPTGSGGPLGLVFALARFNPDGTPDLSFGGVNGDDPGKVSITFTDQSGQPALSALAYAVAVQDDHRIVVGGTADFSPDPTAGSWFAAARLNADGTLDPTFGRGGKALFAGGENDQIHALLLLPDDGTGQKIVFAGQDRPAPGAGKDFAVGRLLPNGTPDAGFAPGSPYPGIRLLSFGAGHSDTAWGLLRQPFDGKLVVTGGTQYVSQFGDALEDFALARLTPDGDSDPGFGAGGQTTLDIGYNDIAYGVALQNQGADAHKIVIAGYTLFQNGPISFSGARFFPDGALDSTFVVGFPNSSGHGDQAQEVLVQPGDDKIVAVGFHTSPTVGGFAAVRLCADPRACAAHLPPPTPVPAPPHGPGADPPVPSPAGPDWLFADLAAPVVAPGPAVVEAPAARLRTSPAHPTHAPGSEEPVAPAPRRLAEKGTMPRAVLPTPDADPLDGELSVFS
jgi:uncharacterized delta-60 repeat protein